MTPQRLSSFRADTTRPYTRLNPIVKAFLALLCLCSVAVAKPLDTSIVNIPSNGAGSIPAGARAIIFILGNPCTLLVNGQQAAVYADGDRSFPITATTKDTLDVTTYTILGNARIVVLR